MNISRYHVCIFTWIATDVRTTKLEWWEIWIMVWQCAILRTTCFLHNWLTPSSSDDCKRREVFSNHCGEQLIQNHQLLGLKNRATINYTTFLPVQRYPAPLLGPNVRFSLVCSITTVVYQAAAAASYFITIPRTVIGSMSVKTDSVLTQASVFKEPCPRLFLSVFYMNAYSRHSSMVDKQTFQRFRSTQPFAKQ